MADNDDTTTFAGYVSGHRSVRYEATGPTPAEAMDLLRDRPPEKIDGRTVAVSETDEGIVVSFDSGRVVVSLTETAGELELRGEAWQPAMGTHSAGNHSASRIELARVLGELGERLADPERANAERELTTAAPAGPTAEALFAQRPAHLSESEALELIVRTIDLTTLAGDDTPGRVRALCAQARQPDPADPSIGPVAAVCVYPSLVSVASELTAGSAVAVASVAGAFPSGLSSLEVRIADIDHAIAAGAHEIDVVLNRSAFLSGDHATAIAELQAMREAIGSRAMKVILETGELVSAAAIRRATQLAIDAGADWIKTSTGKSSTGATPAAVQTIAQTIAEHHTDGDKAIGIKVSGGVRTSADALGYLAIIEAALGPSWLDPDRVRFGASSLLDAVVADLARLTS